MASSSEQTIMHWYGNIPYDNEDQRIFMLDTGSFFEMFRSEEAITSDNILNEIKTRYPPLKMFSPTILSNNEVVKKFRDHLIEMGLQHPPSSIVNVSSRISIKVAHMLYSTSEELSKLQESLTLINNYLQSVPPGTTTTTTAAPPHTAASSAGPLHVNQMITRSNSQIPLSGQSSEPNIPLSNPETSFPILNSVSFPTGTANSTGFSQQISSSTPPNTINQSTNPYIHSSQARNDLYQYSHQTNESQQQQNMHIMQRQMIEIQEQMKNFQAQIQQSLPAFRSIGNNQVYQSHPTNFSQPIPSQAHNHQIPIPQTTFRSPQNGAQTSIHYPNQFRSSNHFSQFQQNQPPPHLQTHLQSNQQHQSEFDSPNETGNPYVPTTRQEPNPRAHHDMAQRFKDKDNKYGGSEEENLSEFLDSYSAISNDYNLTQQQRLQYFHNLFKEEALRYFNTSVKGKVHSFGEACSKIREHFQSSDVQTRVLNELRRTRLSDFISKHETKPKALSALASYISNRFPQCPSTYRHEFHRVDFLKNALMSESWASSILMRVNQQTQYQAFYTELANALQFHEELKAHSNINSSNGSTSDANDKPVIYFTQPKYARKITGKLFNGFQQDRTCWNCDKPGHHHTKCRFRPNPTKIAARKARFYERKGKTSAGNSAKQVLYEMSTALSEILGTDENDNDNETSVYFEMDNESENDSDQSSSKEESTDDDDEEQLSTQYTTSIQEEYF